MNKSKPSLPTLRAERDAARQTIKRALREVRAQLSPGIIVGAAIERIASRAFRGRIDPRILIADSAEAVGVRSALTVAKPGLTQRKRILAASASLAAFGASVGLRLWHARRLDNAKSKNGA